MKLYNLKVAQMLFGGGGGTSATLINKSVTANGVYSASNDNADGYRQVTVNVSGGGIDMSDLLVYIGDYTNDPMTLSLGSVDKWNRRIYGQ